MSAYSICRPIGRGISSACWTITKVGEPSGFLVDAVYWLDKLMPAIVSALVAFAILHIGRVRERRKLSLDTYKEFYSEDVAEQRYKAEQFFMKYPDIDWSKNDPYDMPDPDGNRKGYAAVTRFFARLSILYAEMELDRAFTQKLLSEVTGYWYGLVYEEMTKRTNMYTKPAIISINNALRNGSRATDYTRGYQSGLRRRSENAAIASIRKEILGSEAS